MDCHLLVPDLFWPAAAGSEPYRDLGLPALETFLARGRATRTAGISLERWLAAAFGLPGELPLAPYSLLGDGGEPGDHWWMHADPVHLKVHGKRLILADASRFALAEEEVREFVAALNAQFAPEGITFVAPRPLRWYVRMADEPRAHAAPTVEMAGRNIESSLPAGDDGARWRRIANEAQMLLHAHPRNEAREAVGALPVNSVWFWGAGRARRLVSPYDIAWGNHPLAAGLAAASTVAARPLPASAAPFLKEPGGKTPLVVAMLPPTAYGDIPGWREAATALERAWLAPLLAALEGGALQTLTLHGLGPDYGYTVTLRPGDRFRFWRRRRPLHEYAPRAEQRESCGVPTFFETPARSFILPRSSLE